MMSHAQTPGTHDERTAGILRRRAAGVMGLDDAVAELADADGAAAIAVMIADRVRLRPEMVSRALEADSDEAISVLCRAAGLRINSYSALLRMRRRGASRARQRAEPCVDVFLGSQSRVRRDPPATDRGARRRRGTGITRPGR